MFTKEQLKNQLFNLGIRSTDTLVVHTAFSKVGEVENGVNGYIDALSEYLSDGLLVIPTHTWGVVNKDNPVYDVKKTVPNIGIVPRTAAFRSDGVRSLHPTHSVWAKGKDALEFIEGEENALTPAPVGGVWWKLGERKAKILLVGVLLNRNTYIHAVDEIAELHERLNPEAYTVTVIDGSGNKYIHSMQGHCKHNGSHHFDNYDEAFFTLGVQTKGFFGNAETRVVDAEKCRDTVLKIYSRTNENPCRYERIIPKEWWI